MKESYWGYWLILLGIFVIVIMLLVQNMTSSNTQDYYVLKEVTEAALIESVDLAYYREYGEVRIVKEKFIESFSRRSAEELDLNKTYKISITEIYEAPPKVSVRMKSKSNTFNVMGDSTTFENINKIDTVLEVDVKNSLATSDDISITQSGNDKDKSKSKTLGDSGSSSTTKEKTRETVCLNKTATFLVDPKDVDKVEGVAFPTFTCAMFTSNQDKKCSIYFPNAYAKNGYVVIGWVEQNNPGGEVFEPGREHEISQDTTYIARVVAHE